MGVWSMFALSQECFWEVSLFQYQSQASSCTEPEKVYTWISTGMVIDQPFYTKAFTSCNRDVGGLAPNRKYYLSIGRPADGGVPSTSIFVPTEVGQNPNVRLSQEPVPQVFRVRLVQVTGYPCWRLK